MDTEFCMINRMTYITRINVKFKFMLSQGRGGNESDGIKLILGLAQVGPYKPGHSKLQDGLGVPEICIIFLFMHINVYYIL